MSGLVDDSVLLLPCGENSSSIRNIHSIPCTHRGKSKSRIPRHEFEIAVIDQMTRGIPHETSVLTAAEGSVQKYRQVCLIGRIPGG